MPAEVHTNSGPRGSGSGNEDARGTEANRLTRLMEVLAEEAIGVDSTDSDAHKGRLRQMGASIPSDLEKQLQTELSTYRQAVEAKVDAWKQNSTNTTAAMDEYATHFAGKDENQEKVLADELEHLGLLCQLTDLAQIKAGLDGARDRFTNTLRQLKVQNASLIAQLREENRSLQARLGGPDRRVAQKQGGTLANRAPFERRIRAKVYAHETFSMYLIRITNWRDVISSFDQEEAQILVNSVGEKLASVMGGDTFSGRWYDGYFAAIVNVDKRTAMEGASDIAQQLGGVYTTDRAQVAVRVRIAVVDYILGHDTEQTLDRIDQLIRAFEG